MHWPSSDRRGPASASGRLITPTLKTLTQAGAFITGTIRRNVGKEGKITVSGFNPYPPRPVSRRLMRHLTQGPVTPVPTQASQSRND